MGQPCFFAHMEGIEKNAEHSVFAIQLAVHLSPKIQRTSFGKFDIMFFFF